MEVRKAVATWVWWTAIVGAAWVCVSTVEDKYTLRYNTVSLTTVNATRESYTQFMEALRAQLASGYESHAIPVLRDPSTVPDSQRFVYVELSNWASESVTLAVDVTTAYVVGYRTGDWAFFFSDAIWARSTDVFPGLQRGTLAFGSSYTELQRSAGRNREDIDLGIGALDEAISSVGRTGDVPMSTLARSLIVCIQMVSEGARFKYIEQRVRQSIASGGAFRPDASMLSLENNWGALSTAIQESNQGVFSGPVQLQRPDYSTFNVDSVTLSIIKNLAFIVFACKNQASQFSPLIIRSVVAEDDDTCAHPEPTIRISGRNGLCVDVRDGLYNDGNPIQLSPCKSNMDANQLWTLKRDGTIQSNGKCLTTYGYKAGSYVMIYDCTTAETAATLWEVWDNGTIINPRSALVLTAPSGDSGTTLTVETNIYASRQGWLASNNTLPFVTSIISFMDLCMETDTTNVWLANCTTDKIEQKWAIYADGSVRSQQNQEEACLTSNGHSEGAIITIADCKNGWASQRWSFTTEGTILNLYNGYVIDVKESNPSLRQIILWSFTGNPSQKWLPMP
ncbi:ricin-like [Elaeis guineensis]|uniref:Ribosome-inactivating protein n=1 Tax=Elaeis guineensis var. tenera TaxID=51953 RepID=A0A6I9Q9Q5_ELAGV|nr:ricin-like [Elaeis guineensis]